MVARLCYNARSLFLRVHSMVNTTGTYPVSNQEHLYPQRIAWGVLLVAFAVFCLMCLVLGLGLQYFFFQSKIPMPTILSVSRGTAGLTEADLIEQVVRRGREIYNRAVISTDALSQATISFVDPAQDGRVIASVTMRSSSAVDLERIERPRFNWSSDDYVIELGDITGEMNVRVDEVGRGIHFTLDTQQGSSIYINRPGRYSISATPEQLQVINFEGLVTLIEPDGERFPTAAGQRALFNYAQGHAQLLPGYTNLIAGGSFTVDNVINMDTASSETLGRAVWRCRNTQLGAPSGTFDLVYADGRSALHFARGGGANSHGESFCIQNLGTTGQEGLDVSMYDYLAWRATFKITSHSLGTCGVEGSECPMMLRMDYIPVVPQPDQPAISWYHGFFVIPSTVGEYPLRCNSCTQDHQIINDNAWYTFDSGNLFALIPENQRPKSILNVRFYASGHEYDLVVSDVALLAGRGVLPGASSGG
jgi:hypothetical protein